MKKLYHVEHANATVLPSFYFGLLGAAGGAYSAGKAIPETISPCPGYTEAINYQAPYISPQKYINEDAIYCGALSPHFGHFILDSLARLWFAKKHPHLPIVWTSENAYKPWQEEILEMLSISNPPIFLDNTPTEFKKLYTPIPGFVLDFSFHAEFCEFLSCYESKEPIKGKKVYISRTQFPSGGYENEDKIEAFLQNRGWIIYRSELHSMKG